MPRRRLRVQAGVPLTSAKAIRGGITAGVFLLLAAVVEPPVSGIEIVFAVAGYLVTTFVIWDTPNREQ